MRDPYRVAVEVLYRNYAEIMDAGLRQGSVDHEIALTRGERIVLQMRCLGAPYPDDQLLGFPGAAGQDLHMAQMQGLEPPDDERIARVLVLHQCSE